VPDILEEGDISFLYRPRVQYERVGSLADVQRLLIVLHPWPDDRLRLLTVVGKRLPDVPAHDRSWWFVDRVVGRADELLDMLGRRAYWTKTRGARMQPPARPAGQGRYAIFRHGRHTHLAYQLDFPCGRGVPQRDLNIEYEASYVVSVKDPRLPSPPGIRRWTPPATLPDDLLARFRGRRFVPLDPPALLDHRGTELVVIGASHQAGAALDLNRDAEPERATRRTFLDHLRAGCRDRPTGPLVTGEWR
jgi:hypothetical protein